MTTPRVVFAYRYGLLGGVSAQLLNRYESFSAHYDVRILFGQDHGMATRFGPGVAELVAPGPDTVAAIRRLAPDVFVVIDSPEFLTAWTEAGSPGALVLEVHTTTGRGMQYLADLPALARVRHVVTVSRYMEALLTDRGLATVAPISVVPNCLDGVWADPAEPLPLDAAPLLWVGKLDDHKRWRDACQVMQRALVRVDRDVRPLLIGGFTSPVDEVRALTSIVGNPSALPTATWWPKVEYPLMPRVYGSVGAAGGLTLSTTVNESFGMSVAEALVSGCPVVAPAVGALPELLPAQALYPPDDWDAAVKLTAAVLADDDLRASLLSTADAVRELTRPEVAAAAYRTIVDQLVAT